MGIYYLVGRIIVIVDVFWKLPDLFSLFVFCSSSDFVYSTYDLAEPYRTHLIDEEPLF